jgi:exonuclease VII large subunit
VHKEDGSVVRRPADVATGEAVRLRLAEGGVDATVR